MTFDPDLLARYKAWHWGQVETGDLDPMYPWLRAFTDLTDADPEQGAALTLAYLTWYHAGSAFKAWEAAGRKVPTSADAAAWPMLPTGTERRAHRSRFQLTLHLAALHVHLREHGGALAWLTSAPTWSAMTERVMEVLGNGRWAAYKACDLATLVHDAPWTAPDAGHAHSTGPRKGLALLGVPDPGGNSPDTIAYLDARTRELADLIGDPDLSQVETSLCDFRSHMAGRHPLGHDVVALAEQVKGVPLGLRAMRVAGLGVAR